MSDSAYDLSLFPDEEGERQRLRSQAQTCFPFEYPVYEEFGLVAGTKLLDVGAGNGEPASLLQKEGLDVTCVDRDPLQAGHFASGIRFVAGEATALPFGGATFDATFSRLVFQHLPDPPAVLEEMKRVVRPGGSVVVCDTDHHLRSVHPPLPCAEEALTTWVTQARERGADPSIGGRLKQLMCDAELEDVQMRVVPITTEQIGAAQFASILFSPFLAMMDASVQQASKALIREWLQSDPFAAAFFFIAVGRTPRR